MDKELDGKQLEDKTLIKLAAKAVGYTYKEDVVPLEFKGIINVK